MARIRTIKPEFPQSETMGRCTRDARLLFIQLWTICDDVGRTRAASRMLASLLFPYDDDAPALIDGWLSELEREGAIVRYVVDGQTYLQICKWLNHQKIDKPSASKFPPFDEASRAFDESSRKIVQDQGSRTKEGTKVKDQGITIPLSETPTPDTLTLTEPPQHKPVKSANGTHIPPCPVDEIVSAYHELLPTAPRVRVLTGDREAKLKFRWREWAGDHPNASQAEGVAWFADRFRYASSTKFCTGKVTSKPGETPWHIDFDWIVANERNVIKLFEEKYK